MKKASNIQFFVHLLLVVSLIAGCKVSFIPNKLDNSNPPILAGNASSNFSDIDNALTELKAEQDDFLKKLMMAVRDHKLRQSLTSRTFSQKINTLTEKTEFLSKQVLPSLKQDQQQNFENSLKIITETLDKISEFVINPLTNGISESSVGSKSSVGIVQQKLNEQADGKYGENTYKAINSFFNTQYKKLENNVSELRMIFKVNREFIEIKLSIQEVKKELDYYKTALLSIFILIALLFIFILIALLFIFKKINNWRNTSRREASKNILMNFPNSPWNRSRQRENDEAITPIDQPPSVVNNLTNDREFYQHMYSQLYNNLFQNFDSMLRESRERIESKIFRQIDSKFQDLKYSSNKPQNLEIKHPPVSPQAPCNPPSKPLLHTPPQSFSLTEVSPTEKSLNDRRLGSSQPIILEASRRGLYGVYVDGNNHYLIPSKNFRINQHNATTVEALFECLNHNPINSGTFTLIKPAVVYQLSGGETWQLQERGTLQF